MDFELRLGELKKKLTAKKRKEKILANSGMRITIGFDSMSIQISGQAAALPSMKNSKLPGKNFAAPDFLSRVKSLDELFLSKMAGSEPLRFGLGVRVGLLVINARRARNFDPIGCLETVQDWLEPKTKKVGRKGSLRGWGIGVVDNDSQIVGISLRHDEHKLEFLSPDSTHIFLQLFSKMSDGFSDFLEHLTFLGR